MLSTKPQRWEVYADVVLQRAALTMRMHRGEPPRPLAGLVVDDDEIGVLLADLPGLAKVDGSAVDELLAATEPDLAEAEKLLLEPGSQDDFAAIAWNALLDPNSIRVLALASAIDLDAARQRLVGYLNDDVSRRWLTMSVVSRILGQPGVAALASDSPLVRACLVTVEGETAWAMRAVRVATCVSDALAGARGADPTLPRRTEVVLSDVEDGAGFVLVHSGDRSTRIERAARETAGTRFLVTQLPTNDAEWAAIVRQCVLSGLSPIIEVDARLDLDGDHCWWIERSSFLSIALCSQNELRLESLPERPFVEVRAESELIDIGVGHLLDREQARLTAKALESVAGDHDAAVRRLVTGRLDHHAGRTRPGRTWDELVLPPDHMAVLGELVARYRHRHVVFHEWGFPSRPSTGVTALFTGPSGTGKTMTAEVISTELGLDLYRVDLSSVVSKYIGETEKNLEEIFTASAAGNLVLFFDEADALFGKRSEVSDAHDRYANIEVAYLLQRLERYDGFVVLATNLRKNIDGAFIRRIDVALDFEMPDLAQRRAIWERVFPPSAPCSEIDFALLAREFEVSGGVIRNAAVHAAFLAADQSSSIDLIHVLGGMQREFQKMGRLHGGKNFAAMATTTEMANHAASA